MRFAALARLALLRQWRDPASLCLAVLTAPAFALLYGLVAPGGESAFAAYVPSLLVFSSIMALFGAAMALARERAAGSLLLLRMAELPGSAIIAGFALPQLLINLLSLALTLAAAKVAGFTTAASLPAIFAVCATASTASIGLGLLVAALAPGISRTFLSASVVMFLQLLFSGLLFPRPDGPGVTLGDLRLTLWDLLPTTHLHLLLVALLRDGDSALSGARLAMLGLLALLFVGAGSLAFTRATRTEGRP